MKKKGLLILPLTMMLIIAVALSTATYAWFAVSADAKISTLTVQTAGSDGLQIASIYNSQAYNGTMTLDGSKKWIGSTSGGYGPELSFTTAMASAYGVTGDGIGANMYTAASRSATSYETVPTNAAWWTANNETLTGGEIFYSNNTGMTPAADGSYFLPTGQYNSTPEEKETTLTTRNSGGTYFVRVQVYPTIEVTAANASSYNEENTYYSDIYGLTPANDATYFTAGVWQQVGTLTADIASYTIATSNKIYVRASELTIGKETAWSYEANNGALNGSQNPYYLVPAVANADYFSLNFALKTQRAMIGTGEKKNVADIFLKKLTISASGGMAAASRIAIFGQNATFSAPTLLYYYIPYSTSVYGTGWTNDLVSKQISYREKGTATMQGAGFAYAASSSADLTSANIIYDETALYDGTQTNIAKFYGVADGDIIDKNMIWPTSAAFTTAQATPRTKLDSLGTFTTAGSILYYQLVIWFEGTDAECVSTYAGSGITVDMAFDFYQQWV